MCLKSRNELYSWNNEILIVKLILVVFHDWIVCKNTQNQKNSENQIFKRFKESKELKESRKLQGLKELKELDIWFF